jgi:catechol 2,3-dioxygenase-like lactoylglutathione lyase family enzyme
MLDHVSITVSDISAAERFYDAIMNVLGVVKVGRREDWLGYGERARPAYPERVPAGGSCHTGLAHLRSRFHLASNDLVVEAQLEDVLIGTHVLS